MEQRASPLTWNSSAPDLAGLDVRSANAQQHAAHTSSSYGNNWPASDAQLGSGQATFSQHHGRSMTQEGSGSGTGPIGHQPAEQSLSPGSYSSLFGSRLNLASTIIQEGDEDGEAVAALGQQFTRVVSTDDQPSKAAGVPNVPSGSRLSERRSSVDEHDVFGHLGGLEMGNASVPAVMGSQRQTFAAHQFADGTAAQANKLHSMHPEQLSRMAAPPGAGLGDMPVGDHWSRTLFVGNAEASVQDEELLATFERFGEIQTLFTAFKSSGFVVVQYYDLRAACLAAMYFLNNPALHGRTLDIRFATQEESEHTVLEASVLVLLNDQNIATSELRQLFSQYGEVREIKDVAGKPAHKIVEFFDVRHAGTALKSLNSVDIAKQLLVAQLPTKSQQEQQESWAAAAAAYKIRADQQLQHAASERVLPATASSHMLQPAFAPRGSGSMHHAGSGLSTDATMSNAASINNLLQQQQSGGSFSMQDNHILAQALLQQQGSGANLLGTQSTNDLAGHLLQQQQMQQGSLYNTASGGILAASNPNLAASMLHRNAAGGNPLLAGSSASLAAAAAAAAAADPRLLSDAFNATGMLRRPGSMSTGDLTMLANNAAGGHLGPFRGPLFNPATAQAVQQNFGGLGGAAWSGSMPDLQLAAQQAGLAPWQLQEAAAQLQNQQALLGLQQSASMDNLLALQGLPPAALLLAMNNAQLQLANSLRGGRGPVRPKDRREEGALGGPGGRLSRRNLDPVAEAERKTQQEKLYALDLHKIRAGGDKRTTLMIKNIPNKYTQKMLLGTIDEEFRGTYDFFYLPIDFKNKCNVGYAFINLIKPEYIVPLVERFNHKKWEKFNSEKVCNISYARIQGKMALVAHFQNSSLLHEDKRCRPILFVTDGPMAGEQEPFPMKPLGRGIGRTNSRGSMTSLTGLTLPNGQAQTGDLW